MAVSLVGGCLCVVGFGGFLLVPVRCVLPCSLWFVHGWFCKIHGRGSSGRKLVGRDVEAETVLSGHAYFCLGLFGCLVWAET